MVNYVKKVAVAGLLLLIPPGIILGLGWHWHVEQSPFFSYLLYLMTQTVTRPWGAITTVILAGWLVYSRRQALRPSLITLLMVISLVWGAQGINSLLKGHFQEARPYVTYLQSRQHQPPAEFYQLHNQQRRELISRLTADLPTVAPWQRAHWQHETGYSFPSGHSLFVSCWVLLFFILMPVKRSALSQALVLFWAWSVMWSRMALGMHWPWDVMMSVVVASIWTLLLVALFRKVMKQPLRV